MSEYANEPIRGLPGHLPAGEVILWQGSPAWKRLALSAFHVRGVAFYFAALASFGVIQGSWRGALITVAVGIAGLGLLALLSWASARTTIYTLTNRRVVLRMGIALPKCINLPLTQIGSADLALHADDTGDISLKLTGSQRLGYAALWPHARPWKLAAAQPMLRAVPDARGASAMLARACGARLSIADKPDFEQAVAA